MVAIFFVITLSFPSLNHHQHTHTHTHMHTKTFIGESHLHFVSLNKEEKVLAVWRQK